MIVVPVGVFVSGKAQLSMKMVEVGENGAAEDAGSHQRH